MRVHLHFDGVTTEQLRVVTRECARNREHFPSYNHGGMHGTEPWQPVVKGEGPELWSVTVPACPPLVAAIITSEMDKMTLDREEATQ